MRKRTNRWCMAIIGLAVFVVSLFGQANITPAAPKGFLKQAIHWGLSADWLDPATAGHAVSAHLPLYLFHDALLKPMPGGIYAPCLAESYSISPDQKIYEFNLRREVKFHNGDTMTAEDVVFSFSRYKAAFAKSLQARTEKVEAVNPYLVRVRFKEPYPDFLEHILPGVSTIGWVVPKKYVERVGEAGFKKHPVGAGPYKFVEFIPGVKLVGEAFEEYWRKVPHVKRLEFFVVTETATRLAMIRKGEVDIATLMTDVFYEDVKKDPKLRLLTPLSPSIWLVYMAAQWDPKSPWSDPRVRKAASLAIDRQMVVKLHGAGSNPSGSLGLEGDPLAVHFPADPYDPERAKKLLTEAGYPAGFNGGKFYSYEGAYWPMGEMVANYWKAVGVTVDTVLLDRPAWFANRTGGKMKGGTFIDPLMPPTIGGRLSYLFGSTSYGNYADIQALWDQYGKAIDPKVRKDLIGQIQRLVQERTIFIPLRNSATPNAVGSKVKGDPYKIPPLIWFAAPFEDIELVE
jgi:peptide/nickel transport system substrate-binding protein